MKNMKKIGALVLALVMVLSLSAMALAEGEAKTDDTWNDYNGIESSENTLKIAKALVFKNAEATTVREPNITYTYTISSTDPDPAAITGVDKETPANEWTVPVKAGPLAAVTGAITDTTSTITFADTNTFGATAAGASNTKYAAFTFDTTKFKVDDVLTAGIYRYAIAETTSVEKSTVGIAEANNYQANRFLDVYVHWKDADHTALEIYGYVLFEETEAGTSIAYNVKDDLAKKSPGYVNTASGSGELEDVDVYTTQNLVISKKTTGSLADKNNDFPVAITFTKAQGLADGIKLDYTVSGNGTLTKVETDDAGDYVVLNTKMVGTVRDGSTITITGIPDGSSVVMNETNNTVDFYRVKAGTEADGNDLLDEAVVEPGDASNDTGSVTVTEETKEIHLTNTLSEISPTGYVVRIAPYALMLAAGIVLFILMRRRREDAAEA